MEHFFEDVVSLRVERLVFVVLQHTKTPQPLGAEEVTAVQPRVFADIEETLLIVCQRVNRPHSRQDATTDLELPV